MNCQKLLSELQNPRPWFLAKDTADKLDLYIYDVIGPDFWEEGIRAAALVRTIKESKAKEIQVRINSPGGDVFDSISIYNALKNSGRPVTTVVDGIAASMASVVFTAGDVRRMGAGTMLMVHDAWGIEIGNAAAMLKKAETLGKVNEQLVTLYSARGPSPDAMREYMAKETYFQAADAVELGLATEAVEELKIAACAWDLEILAGIPERFAKIQKAKEKRDMEKALRDAGLSAREAKRQVVLAQRDAGQDDAELIALLKSNINILTQS